MKQNISPGNTEPFSGTNQEFKLNLETQTDSYQSSLYDLFVSNSTELNISVTTVPDQQLQKSQAFIGIWKGTGKMGRPETMDNFVGVTALAFNTDGTAIANYTVSLEKPGLSLLTDPFTIGLFLTSGDTHSLAASVNLLQGKATNYESSTISIVDANNRFLTVFYSVPGSINPSRNVDWLILYKGGVLTADRGSALKKMYILGEDNTGIIKMPVDDILMKSGMYFLEYNPGYNPNPSSAACSFKVV